MVRVGRLYGDSSARVILSQNVVIDGESWAGIW